MATAFCCQLYLSLKDAPRTTAHLGIIFQKDALLLFLWSYLSPALSLSLVFYSLLFLFSSLRSLFGVSHIFQVSLSTCAMKDAFVSRFGEDFMPLPGDFKLINHIKCFAVPSPKSRVGPDSSRNCVKANY